MYEVYNWRHSHATVNGGFFLRRREFKTSQVIQSDKFKQYADDSML